MNYLIANQDIIYIVSDITAGVFLTVLVTSNVTNQASKRPGFTHLFAAATLILAGVFARLFALMVEMLPEEIVWHAAIDLPLPRSANVIWIMAFILIVVGICESVVHVIYVNEGQNGTVFKPIYMMGGMIIAAGIAIFAVIDSIDAFTFAILVQLIGMILYLRRSGYKRADLQFRRASTVAVVTFVIPLIFGSVRLTGLGLSLMLIILNEQYHERLGQELVENEAALAKSKLQLLAEQISPHYIYNSLQSIRYLCGKDPEKARDAIDAFSDYLRGNLESLTQEELIPFTRELEITRSYLELEKIAGRRAFDVEYDMETVDFMLPPLVLQPLAENAIKYGAGNGSGELLITITTRENEGAVYIEVTDRPRQLRGSEPADKETVIDVSGTARTGIPEGSQNRNKMISVGLENVRTRLALQCGGTLDISGFDEGTKVTIMLPKPHQTAI